MNKALTLSFPKKKRQVSFDTAVQSIVGKY